jgi:hypothetical protein
MNDGPQPTYPLTLGKDRVFRRGNQLVVLSLVENPEWEVRENRKTAIVIGDEVWCLTGADAAGKRGMRYFLDPWPDHIHQIPGRRIRYDAGYVEARDEAMRRNRQCALAARVLVHFRLLIGFLPSGAKRTIEGKFGVSARSASFASIMLELFLFFAVGAIIWIFSFANMLGSAAETGFVLFDSAAISIWITLLLFFDMVMRYDSYWRGAGSPLGFCEWAVSPAFRAWESIRAQHARAAAQQDKTGP